MRGVKKKQKNFQNNYIFLILIKIILICSIKKSIFLNKDLNFFVRTRFSFSIYNTLFFVNTIFFYNFFNLSIFTRKFFFLKKKIKKFTKTGFNFFFKKFLRKRGVCFKKTVFNQIQVQKLYNQTDLPLLPSWVKYYQKYVNIFTKSHKTKILWRIILKRKKRQFNTQYTPTLRN